MGIPAYKGIGTFQGALGGTNITVPWPTHAVDDIALLFVQNYNDGAFTFITQAGFTLVTSFAAGAGGGVDPTHQTGLFWCRATSSSMTSPVISNPVVTGQSYMLGVITTYSGCKTIGNPWDSFTGDITQVNITGGTVPSLTTNVPNTLIVLATCGARDNATSGFNNNYANANFTSIGNYTNNASSAGNGGNINTATAIMAAAGPTGTTSESFANAQSRTHFIVALTGGDTTLNVSDVAVVTSSAFRPFAKTFADIQLRDNGADTAAIAFQTLLNNQTITVTDFASITTSVLTPTFATNETLNLADFASIETSVQAAAVVYNQTVTADLATITSSVLTASIPLNQTINLADVASITTSVQTPAVVYNQTTTAGFASIATSVLTPTLVYSQTAAADLVSITISVLTAILSSSQTISLADTASITSSALTPTVAFGQTLAADTISLTAEVTDSSVSARPDFAKLESFTELRRVISGHTAPYGGSELADYLSSRVNAAVRSVSVSKDWRHIPDFERSPTSSQRDLKTRVLAQEINRYKDLDAFLRPFSRGSNDISTSVLPIPGVDLGAFALPIPPKDLPAILFPFHTRDLEAAANAIPPVDLAAAVLSIPPADLGAEFVSIPSVNLPAKGGGHFPAHLTASVSITQPVLLPAFIRAASAGQAELGASITQVGGFKDLPAILNVGLRENFDLTAFIRVKTPQDLRAFIHPYHVADLGAEIITQRVKDLRAIIAGYVRQVPKDLSAYLRIIFPDYKDLPVTPFHMVHHTHTSDKLVNITRVSKIFPKNVYAFGTRTQGFFFLTIEPIFGYFPDLHGYLNAVPFSHSDLNTSIVCYTRTNKDVSANVNVGLPLLNINKLVLSLHPSKDMHAELTSRGGYKELNAIIRMSRAGSTGTASDAGFVTTATTYRFYLGTNKGLLVAPEIRSTLKTNFYINNHPTPDLHAFVHGWHVADFGAYISWYPYVSLGATLTPLDFTRIGNLHASIGVSHVSELMASISRVGHYVGLGATLESSGGYSDLSAIIVPYINILSLLTLPVSTKPFSNLGASINFSSEFGCGGSSAFLDLSAFVRVVLNDDASVKDLPTEINVTSMRKDLEAEITGRKRTRIRTVTLNFRSKIRDTSAIPGYITPLRMAEISLAAEIFGKSHEFDLSAEITTVRLSPQRVNYTAFETMVNLAHPDDLKKIMLSFKSQVSTYVYDEVANSVFSTDRGTWAIDLRTVVNNKSFFDSSDEVRVRELSDISEFYSLDEAIRFALVVLCERVQTDLPTEIAAVGGAKGLRATLTISSADRIKNLSAKLVSVLSHPDLTAEINTGPGSSSLSTLMASLAPSRSTPVSLGAVVNGEIISDFSASLTVI